MLIWLRAHRKALTDTFGYLSANTLSSLVVWSIVGVALALPAGLYLAWVNLGQVEQDWTERPAVSVFFVLEAGPDEVARSLDKIQALPTVTAIQYISPDQALTELGGRVSLAEDLARMENNPLPASARVAVSGGNPEAFAVAVEAWPEIDQVLVESEWLQRLAALSSLFGRLAAVIGVVLGLAALAVSGSAVRLVIQARLEEVLVLTLVGATPGQVRRPFIYLGGWYGLGGGLAAALWLLIALGALAGPMSDLTASYGVEFVVSGFNWQLVLSLLGAGVLLGVVGAVVTVWRAALGADA